MLPETRRDKDRFADVDAIAKIAGEDLAHQLGTLAKTVPPRFILAFATRCVLRIRHMPSIFTLNGPDPLDPIVPLAVDIDQALLSSQDACSTEDSASLKKLAQQAKHTIQRLEQTGHSHYDELPQPVKYTVSAADRLSQATVWYIENLRAHRGAGVLPSTCAYAAANAIAAFASLTDNDDRRQRLLERIRAAIDRDIEALSNLPTPTHFSMASTPFGNLWPFIATNQSTDDGSTRRAATLDDLMDVLRSLDQRIDSLLEPLVAEIEANLTRFAQTSFGSVEANQRATSQIQQLLNRLGKRVRCPKDGCGEPAILRCHGGAGKGNGVFQFEHSTGGRKTTHLAAATLPELHLVPAPADKRRHDLA